MIMISSDSCLLLSPLFPLFLPARFRFSKEASLPIFSPEKPSLHSVVYLRLINFLAPLSLAPYICRFHCTDVGRDAGTGRILRGSVHRKNEMQGFTPVSWRERTKGFTTTAFSLASKQVVNIHFRLKLRLIPPSLLSSSPPKKNQSRRKRRRRRSLGSTSIESGGRWRERNKKERKKCGGNSAEETRSGNGNRNRNSGDIGLPLICQFDRRYNAQKEAARVGNGR